MACIDCQRDDRCPWCAGVLRPSADGLYCVDCGYYRRVVVTVGEDTLAMTEIRKPGEPLCFGTK